VKSTRQAQPARPFAPLAAASIAIALLGWGCGSAPTPVRPPPPPPPPVDDNLLALAPAGAQLVVWIDVARLRASPMWDVAEMLIDAEEYREIERITGVDLLESVDEVLVSAAQKADGQDMFVTVVKGRFDAPAAIRSMVAAERGRAILRRGHEGVEVEKFQMLEITARTAIACSKNTIDDVAALAEREGRSLLDDPRFDDLPLHGKPVALMRFRRGPQAPDLSRFRVEPPIEDVDKITALDATMSLDQGADVFWSFSVEDKLIAASTARELRRLCNRMSHHPLVMLIGFAWLFDRVEVDSQGTRVDVRIDLDEVDVEQIRRLAERLRKIRELGQTGEGEIERRPKLHIPGLYRSLPVPPGVVPQLDEQPSGEEHGQ
jgi:hypothetical protein